MKVFHLKFNKEADAHWYIDLPHYPFAHHNLMMVAGADRLCQYGADKEGHPDYALVDVTLLVLHCYPERINLYFKN